MTYYVFGGTLNLALSIYHDLISSSQQILATPLTSHDNRIVSQFITVY